MATPAASGEQFWFDNCELGGGVDALCYPFVRLLIAWWFDGFDLCFETVLIEIVVVVSESMCLLLLDLFSLKLRKISIFKLHQL